MKKLRAKLKNRRKDQGSGLVLVIVAVAFIGILVGSLLTAVGYAYRLKLYDYNAKDNFYYLEQAMDEVYAGVGNETLSCMQTAYTDVVNQMVEYSESTRNYITRDPKELKDEKWYNPKTKKMESAVYHCRSDRKGTAFDKEAMIKASEALGHSRLDVVAGHYIR